MRRILAGLVLILMLTGGAAAGPYADGVAAYDRGDYATAMRLFRPLAEQGRADAQYNLGNMYSKGLGVPQDYAEAVKWYRLAAEQGLADAQYNLGVMYSKGLSVPQDEAEAVKWFRLAADQGDAGAQYNLGIMYSEGQGVAHDLVKAHMWFNLAASRFPASKTEYRDSAIQNRDLAASRLTPAQLAEAQKLVREWKPK